MNAVAPTYIPVPPVPPYLHQMQPGQLFRSRSADSPVLALLHHTDVQVADTKRIWCVVIAAAPKMASQVTGELVSLPRDTEVQRVRAVRLDLALLD
ncbi:MAG TPA: hypothetical protein PKZ76_03460 [Xanthomonadaceae bacterium]|nr:hypothetical protein [Xanthomonadaceae bacterium]